MKNQDQYNKAVKDALQIKDIEMRERYVSGLKLLWGSEIHSERTKLKATQQGLYQALFFQEMVEEAK